MRRVWLGLEIDVVGLPPLGDLMIDDDKGGGWRMKDEDGGWMR